MTQQKGVLSVPIGSQEKGRAGGGERGVVGSESGVAAETSATAAVALMLRATPQAKAWPPLASDLFCKNAKKLYIYIILYVYIYIH